MTLRTQVNSYILVGDSLVDRPAPGGVAQGTIFHIAGGGATYILVIDVANVHTWELISGGVGSQGPGLLKWAGGANFGSQASPVYIGDDPDQTSGIAPLEYPFSGPSTGHNFQVNVTALDVETAITVELVINGVAVASIPIAAPGLYSAAGPFAFVASNLIDVRIVKVTGTPKVALSASLEVTRP